MRFNRTARQRILVALIGAAGLMFIVNLFLRTGPNTRLGIRAGVSSDLAVPSGRMATAPGTDRFDLSWDDPNSGRVAYVVERSDDGATGCAEVARLGMGETPHTDGGLEAATTYDYGVKATEPATEPARDAAYSEIFTAMAPGEGPPAPEQQRTVRFRLYPVESVQPGVATRVAFGLPLPEGEVQDLSAIRLFEGATERPIAVTPLTPWRRIVGALTAPKTISGPSWRAVLIQAEVAFPNSSDGRPEAIDLQVRLGQGLRQVEDLTPVADRDTWVVVNDPPHWPAPLPDPLCSSATALAAYPKPAEHLYEPKAFAVFPVDYYSECQIKGEFLPLGGQADSATNDLHQPFFALSASDYVDPRVERLQGHKADDPRTVMPNALRAELTAEAWLYDRATTTYAIALRHPDERWRFFLLRDAHRMAQWYADNIDSAGALIPKTRDLIAMGWPVGRRDPKYSYAECLAINYWLTGDERLLAKVEATADVGNLPVDPPGGDASEPHGGNPNRGIYFPGIGQWTERHVGFHLANNIVAWELTGLEKYLDRLVNTHSGAGNKDNGDQVGIVNNLLWMQQTGSGGARLHPTTGQPVGAFMHTSAEHKEGSGGDVVASPWMSALIVDALERYRLRSDDPRIGPCIRTLASYFATEGDSLYWYTTVNVEGYNTIRLCYPYYMAGRKLDGAMLYPTSHSTGASAADDSQHCIEVAAIMARAYHLALQAGEQTEAADHLKACADLLRTHQLRVLFGNIAPTRLLNSNPELRYPTYILNPSRIYGWQHRPVGSMPWHLRDTELRGTYNPPGTPHLRLTLSGPDVHPELNGVATVTLTCENLGPGEAIDVSLRAFLKARTQEYEFLSETTGGGLRLTLLEILWPNLGTLAPGSSANLTCQIRYKAEGATYPPGRPPDPLMVMGSLYWAVPGDTDYTPAVNGAQRGSYNRGVSGKPLIIPRWNP